MGDETDKKYLESLNEIEREKIISERYAKRKELEERNKIQQQMRTREGSKRLKTHNESQSNALSDIKKRRQAKSLTQESSDEEGPEEPPTKKIK